MRTWLRAFGLGLAAAGWLASVPAAATAVGKVRPATKPKPSAAPAEPAEPAAPVFEKDQKAMADFMAEMGKVPEAIEIYDELLKARPEDVELIDAFIPICRKSPECLPRVLGLLRDQVRLAPDDKDAVEDLFEVLMKQAHVAEAVHVLAGYLSRHVDDSQVRLALIETLSGAGRGVEALATLDAMPGHKDDPDLLLMRIDLLEVLGRLAELDVQLASLLQKYPNNAGALARLGERDLARGEVDAAAAALAKGLAQHSADPKDEERLNELATAVAVARAEKKVDNTLFRVEIELADAEADLEQRDDY